MDAYDLVLRMSRLSSAFEPDPLVEALCNLDEALALDPTYALAMAAAAYVRDLCRFQGWLDQPGADRAAAAARIERVLATRVRAFAPYHSAVGTKRVLLTVGVSCPEPNRTQPRLAVASSAALRCM